MSTDSNATFGVLLRRARRSAGLTQEELAEHAGVSAHAISDLERGVSRVPRLDTLALLIDALELPSDERRRWEGLRRRLARQTISTPRAATRLAAVNLLPAPLTSFVGREREQVEVLDLLRRTEIRLLTLTGPGGVGKTRLAITIARRLSDDYPDGVAFIDLAPVREPDLVLSEMAAALGVRFAGALTPLAALVARLQQSSPLLVIDNVEHVVESAPEFAQLLVACPHVTILATSRRPLRIQGEWEFPLSPLDLPDGTQGAEVAALVEVAAVALFTQRAQAIRPEFRVTPDNAVALAEICQHLDGLPLAIELAAARIRLLPPRAMLERLQSRLPLLVSIGRDVPDRHRTLRSTIQWSYDLLSPAEQRLFRTLSVFQGGWTLDGTEQVASEELDVLSCLESLVDHSFVQVREQPDGTARFEMLETIREYGLEQLKGRHETESAHRRHADYLLALVEQAEPHFRGADEAYWVGRLEAEHANLRAALRWTRDRAQRGDMQATVRGLRMAAAAWWFWYLHGHFLEAREQLSAVVQLYRDRRADDDSLADSAEAAITYAKALFGLASFSFWVADIERFGLLLEECRAIFRQFGQGRDMALSLIFMGYASQHVGDFHEAEALLEEGTAAFREQGDVGGAALGLLGMGEMRLRQQSYGQGADYLLESLALFTTIGDVRGMAAARGTLGAVRLGQRRLAEARALLDESLRARSEIGDKGGIAWCLERMADLALVDTAPPDRPPMRAARLLGAARGLRNAIRSPIDPVDQSENERLIRAAQAQLSESAFIAAWESGRTMAPEDVVAYALRHGTEETGLDAPHPRLSKREFQVLRFLTEGCSNQEIAAALSVSPHTVASHVASIMNKLGVESRTAAATWAVRHGLHSNERGTETRSGR